MTEKGCEGGKRPTINVVGQGLKETDRSRLCQRGSPSKTMRNVHPCQGPFHEGNQLRIRDTDHHVLRRAPPSEPPKYRSRSIGLVPGPLDHPDVRIGDGDVGPKPPLRADAAKAVEAVPDLLGGMNQGSDVAAEGPHHLPDHTR